MKAVANPQAATSASAFFCRHRAQTRREPAEVRRLIATRLREFSAQLQRSPGEAAILAALRSVWENREDFVGVEHRIRHAEQRALLLGLHQRLRKDQRDHLQRKVCENARKTRDSLPPAARASIPPAPALHP